MKLKLADILPNPSRDFALNPLKPEKIAELKASITSLGFWDNVVVRINKDGKPEMAYGHNRIAAAIEAGVEEADFIVRKLDDGQMAQMMDRENRDVYKTDVLSVLEGIRGVVKLLAEGRISPFKHDPKTPKVSFRYAPSFVQGCEPDSGSDTLAYTAADIALYLGRTKKQATKDRNGVRASDEVLAAFQILAKMEMKLPGWTLPEIKQRYTNYVNIPVRKILEESDSCDALNKKRLEVATKQAAEAKHQGEVIKKQVLQMQADGVKAAKEERKLAAQQLEAQRAKIEEEVQELKKQRAAKEKEDKERDKKIRDAQDQAKQLAKTEESANKEAERLRKEQDRRRVEQSESRYKNILNRLNDILSEGDPLYRDIVNWREGEVNSEWRARVAKALRDVTTRAEGLSPYKTEPSAKEELAMKTLKSKAKKARKK